MTVDAELVVAAAQPPVVDGDVRRNVAAHVEMIERAKARVVVFPELSLTGYVLNATPVDLSGVVVDALVSACAAADSVALIGAPVENGGARFITTVRVDGTDTEVAYRKTFLHGPERDHFQAGTGPQTISVDGWRIGLGICRDTGIDEHVQGTAALDVDLYVCGVLHHAFELTEQRRRGRRLASACRAPVVMAGFAGPTGGGFVRTAGHSAIWSATADVLAEADGLAGGIARTAVRKPVR